MAKITNKSVIVDSSIGCWRDIWRIGLKDQTLGDNTV